MRIAFAAILWLWLIGMDTAIALQGSVHVVSFNGPVTGKRITFSLYLPPDYSNSVSRYPLVVHLHGLTGSHGGPQTNTVPASHESAVAAGLIEPCIIAFPDGYRDSFWADSANSEKPAEANVRLELLPYLDANYRTAGTASLRVIQGFSMGGFGAAKFATKFPELFAACVIYDGAMLTWAQFQQRHASLAAEIFNNSSATFDLFSPWHWLIQNAETLRGTMAFRDVVGALRSENRAWRDALIAQSLAQVYVETDCAHQLPCLLNTEGSNAWAFVASVFAQRTNELRMNLFVVGTDVVLQWNSRAGQHFDVLSRTTLDTSTWGTLETNWPASSGNTSEYVHTDALTFAGAGFYRVRWATATNTPSFTFDWRGTNFTYTDAQRSFTGILLKPPGEGPFPAVIVSHGAGGSVNGYSLVKAREMLPWGVATLAPTLTHAAGGETNPVNMGSCQENLARISACLDVLATLPDVDTNRVALFGHSMGAFATIGSAAAMPGRMRVVAITGGGIIPDSAGATNSAPTVSEASAARAPILMVHCDGDPVVPATRSALLQQVLNSNSVTNQRILISSNSIATTNNWHNIQNDPNANTLVLTNTRAWFQQHGVLP